MKEIKFMYPHLISIKMVLGLSKSKKLDNLIEYIDSEDLVKDVSLVSRPHMRLYKIEEVHKVVK